MVQGNAGKTRNSWIQLKTIRIYWEKRGGKRKDLCLLFLTCTFSISCKLATTCVCRHYLFIHTHGALNKRETGRNPLKYLLWESRLYHFPCHLQLKTFLWHYLTGGTVELFLKVLQVTSGNIQCHVFWVWENLISATSPLHQTNRFDNQISLPRAWWRHVYLKASRTDVESFSRPQRCR